MVCDRLSLVIRFAGRFLGLAVLSALVLSCSDDSGSGASVEVPASSASGEVTVPYVGGSPVVVTEIDPVNISFKDHEGGDAGWVEFFNPAETPVNLSGLYLTDDLSQPRKWAFGNVPVPAQGFMVLYLSGKDLPDYEAPHDSTDLIGPGCWKWTDAQSEPVAGESRADNLPGKSKVCFTENGSRAFGSRMQFGENEELGWTSIAVFVGTGSSSKDDVVDISAANEILLTGYVTAGRKLAFRLAQPDVDDWLGWEAVIEGTGDSNTTYAIGLPQGMKLPDLQNIYGTRFSPESNEMKEVDMKVTSFIARNRGHEPHANFKLHHKGGSLYLMNEDGAIVDSIAYPAMPVGKTWSFGASPEGAATYGFADPSPYGGAFMSVVYSERSPAITDKLPPSGFYKEPFAVAFDADAHVRCVQGGALPDGNVPEAQSLTVSSTTVLRCASFVPGMYPGDVETRTYVFEEQPTIASVFITANPLSLFDPDTGLYMDGPDAQEKIPHYGANYWSDRELPVTVELFEPGVNSPAFAKDAGFQIFGNYSRANAKKSVAIVFREKYGDNRLKYPLFPAFPQLTTFKGFILRVGNFGQDYIHDDLASSLSEGLGVDYQRSRPAIVFYNGEYYGIQNIRERSNRYYFETHYGYDPDEIDLLKADNSASSGESSDYVELLDWLESHPLDSDENYRYVATKIDVDNFINYQQTEIYANNRDWPSNNLKKWRVRNPATPWRWFLYDMDFGFGNDMSEYTNNIFEFAAAEDGPDWPNGPKSTFLFRKLLENKSFTNKFVNRMSTLLATNFEKTRVLARIEAMMGEISAEVARDQKRWGHSAKWMDQVLDDMKYFAESRESEILFDMQEFFALGEFVPVTFAASGSGRVLVEGLPLDRPAVKVTFFKGTPVIVSAEGVNGGVFTGWSDGVTDVTRTIMPGEIDALTANFK